MKSNTYFSFWYIIALTEYINSNCFWCCHWLWQKCTSRKRMSLIRYERVYLLLCKLTDIAFNIQQGDLPLENPYHLVELVHKHCIFMSTFHIIIPPGSWFKPCLAESLVAIVWHFMRQLLRNFPASSDVYYLLNRNIPQIQLYIFFY